MPKYYVVTWVDDKGESHKTLTASPQRLHSKVQSKHGPSSGVVQVDYSDAKGIEGTKSYTGPVYKYEPEPVSEPVKEQPKVQEFVGPPKPEIKPVESEPGFVGPPKPEAILKREQSKEFVGPPKPPALSYPLVYSEISDQLYETRLNIRNVESSPSGTTFKSGTGETISREQALGILRKQESSLVSKQREIGSYEQQGYVVKRDEQGNLVFTKTGMQETEFDYDAWWKQREQEIGGIAASAQKISFAALHMWDPSFWIAGVTGKMKEYYYPRVYEATQIAQQGDITKTLMLWGGVQAPAYETVIIPLATGGAFKYISLVQKAAPAGSLLSKAIPIWGYGVGATGAAVVGADIGATIAYEQKGLIEPGTTISKIAKLGIQASMMGVGYKYTKPSPEYISAFGKEIAVAEEKGIEYGFGRKILQVSEKFNIPYTKWKYYGARPAPMVSTGYEPTYTGYTGLQLGELAPVVKPLVIIKGTLKPGIKVGTGFEPSYETYKNIIKTKVAEPIVTIKGSLKPTIKTKTGFEPSYESYKGTTITEIAKPVVTIKGSLKPGIKTRTGFEPDYETYKGEPLEKNWLSTKVLPKPIIRGAYETHYFVIVFDASGFIPTGVKVEPIVSIKPKPFKLYTLKDIIKSDKELSKEIGGRQVKHGGTVTVQETKKIVEPVVEKKIISESVVKQITSPLSKEIVVPEELLKPVTKYRTYGLQEEAKKMQFFKEINLETPIQKHISKEISSLLYPITGVKQQQRIDVVVSTKESQVQKVGELEIQKMGFASIIGQVQLQKQEQIQRLLQKQIQSFEQGQIQKFKQEQIQRLELEQIFMFGKIEGEPSELFKPGIDSWNVYVKPRQYVDGKHIHHGPEYRVTSHPLRKSDAVSFGHHFIDDKSKASFTIRPSDEKPHSLPKSVKTSFFDILHLNEKKENYFVEPSKHRIDTLGEIKEISMRGWMSHKKKNHNHRRLW